MSNIVYVTGADARLYPFCGMRPVPGDQRVMDDVATLLVRSAEDSERWVTKYTVLCVPFEPPHDCAVKVGEVTIPRLTVLDKDPRLVAVEAVTEELRNGKPGRVVTL